MCIIGVYIDSRLCNCPSCNITLNKSFVYFLADPPEPGPLELPTEVSHTANTIRIRYRKHYFSNKNGQIIGYTVIVVEDDTKSSRGVELRTWKDVQSYSLWPPYQVIKDIFQLAIVLFVCPTVLCLYWLYFPFDKMSW